MSQPVRPKIYHIVHVDRLASIMNDEFLWCDAKVVNQSLSGTNIGMNNIKQRRLSENRLSSHPDLFVGQCVPFYFCPRSIMLYVIYQANHLELNYKGGQVPIVHLESDLYRVVDWANTNNKRWAFTLSNAGSSYFEDRCNLDQLDELDWDAIHAVQWKHCREGKQAEFLLEYCFPFELVDRIGTYNQAIATKVLNSIPANHYTPSVEIKSNWYY